MNKSKFKSDIICNDILLSPNHDFILEEFIK